jgi:DNA-binding transcriptional ArsR family regulator
MGVLNSLFHALADPTRRKILSLLKNRDLTPGEISESFTISKPSISHHLDILKRADLVITERKGQNIFYSLNVSVFDEAATAIMDFFKNNKTGNAPGKGK